MIMTKKIGFFAFLLCLYSQGSVFGASTTQLIDTLSTLKTDLIKLSQQLSPDSKKEQKELKKLNDIKGGSTTDILDQLKDLDLKYLPEKDIEGERFEQHFVSTIVSKVCCGNPKPDIIEHCIDYVLPEEDIELSMCSCHNIVGRLTLVLSQLNRINQLYPDKSAPFVHTSRNSWRLLQEYMFTYGLLLCGYKNITICCIDEGYGFKESQELVTKIKDSQKLFTKIAAKYGATIKLLFFNSVYDYLQAIHVSDAPAPKSHSFSSIDPALITDLSRLDTKSSFIVFSKQKEGIFGLLLEYNYDDVHQRWNIRPHFAQNSDLKAPDDQKKIYDAIFQDLQKLEAEYYESTDAIISRVREILKQHNQEEINPVYFNSSLDSKNLIENARTSDNPIIFEGVRADNSKVEIKEYTLDKFRTIVGGAETISAILSEIVSAGLLKNQFDWLKEQAQECYTESLFKTYESTLKMHLDNKKITQQQFDELKTLAQNKSKAGDFDGWSKNITQNNYMTFVEDLNKAFEYKKR